jgi:TonB family protein
MMKEKVRIMKTPPPVTDEEINRSMDFDDLLRKNQIVLRKKLRVRRMRNLAVILVAAVSVPSAWMLWRDQPESPLSVKENAVKTSRDTAPGEPLSDTLDLRAPDDRPPVSTAHEKSAAVVRSDRDSRQSPETTVAKDTVDQQPVYVQAEPAEGYQALYTYFSRNLRYPPSAVKDSVEGVVNVSFVISTSGKATHIAIEKSLGPSFDKEVVRLMENMPMWKPASYGGRTVESKISLPITFSLMRTANP